MITTKQLIESFTQNNIDFTIDTNPSKRKLTKIRNKIKLNNKLNNSYKQLYECISFKYGLQPD